MIANPKTITKSIVVIGNPEEIAAADKGELLTQDGRLVLTVKGGDTKAIVKLIYDLFSRKTDNAGNPFTMSRALHGLCHHDSWGAIARISGPEFESYLQKWTQFVERIENNAGPALKLVDSLPQFAAALFSQGRYLSPEIAARFTWTD